MEVMLNNTQKVLLTIHPVDAAGQPAQVEGEPEWASSDQAIAEVEIEEGGMSAWVTTPGATGRAIIHVTADADLGEGVVVIEGNCEIVVTAAQAVDLGLTAGEPVPEER